MSGGTGVRGPSPDLLLMQDLPRAPPGRSDFLLLARRGPAGPSSVFPLGSLQEPPKASAMAMHSAQVQPPTLIFSRFLLFLYVDDYLRRERLKKIGKQVTGSDFLLHPPSMQSPLHGLHGPIGSILMFNSRKASLSAYVTGSWGCFTVAPINSGDLRN